MAWINGQWVDDRQVFGGMLGGIGVQPRFEEGYTGDTSLDVIGGPMQPPPFGDRPGMPNLPPQVNPPGYSRGPQMQTPFGGGLGNIDQWNPLQPDSATQYQPPQMMPPLNIPGRMPAPVQQPIYDRGPQMQPTLPPQFPSLPPQMTFDPPMPPQVDYQPPGLRPTPPPPQVRPPMPPIPPRPPVLPPIVDPILPPPPKKKKVKKVKTKRKPIDQRGYSKGPGGSPTRPIGQKGYTQEGRGPKGRGTLSPIRSGRGRGDR